MNLKEALKSARDFNNFFKAFKNIEEIIEAGANLDQNIKELEATRDRLVLDIEALKGHKNDAEQLLLSVKEAVKQAKADQASEMRTVREETEAEKKALNEEIAIIKEAKMSALKEHDDVMARISLEKDKLAGDLARVKEELKAIKGKL